MQSDQRLAILGNVGVVMFGTPDGRQVVSQRGISVPHKEEWVIVTPTALEFDLNIDTFVMQRIDLEDKRVFWFGVYQKAFGILDPRDGGYIGYGVWTVNCCIDGAALIQVLTVAAKMLRHKCATNGKFHTSIIGLTFDGDQVSYNAMKATLKPLVDAPLIAAVSQQPVVLDMRGCSDAVCANIIDTYQSDLGIHAAEAIALVRSDDALSSAARRNIWPIMSPIDWLTALGREETDALRNQLQSAQNIFCNMLQTYDIHPVIIFGSHATGKSVLLASLLSFGLEWRAPSGSPKFEVSFGNHPFISNSQDIKINNFAKYFFDTMVPNWKDAIASIERTDVDSFFIPVDVTLTYAQGDTNTKRFAFLDWPGEVQHPPQPVHPRNLPVGEKQPQPRELEELVKNLLQFFSKPISVLFLLPKEANNDAIILRVNTIMSMVERYKKDRNSNVVDKDHCLFLLNKWDKTHVLYTPEFSAPNRSRIEQHLNSPFIQSAWATFNNLPGNLAMMQYSAGSHSKEGIRNGLANNQDKEKVLRYPKTLWNWLFMNATKNKVVVFPDVMPPSPPMPIPPTSTEELKPEASDLQKLMSWLNRI